MRVRRIASVTAGLAFTGALIGAVLGALLLIVWALRMGAAADVPDAALLGGAVGAGLGAVLTPITAWVFLRRVPLGRAMAETAVGTVIGAAAGLVLGSVGWEPGAGLPAGVVGALIGFLAAALRLRFRGGGRRTRVGRRE